jgi:dihydrofolate reductase
VRSLVVTENITLDGVIDAAGDWFAPSGADESNQASDIAEMLAVERGHREAAGALLVGRETFEAFRGYWPLQTDDPTGVSDYLNRVEKYVVSSTLDDPAWDRSHVLRGPLVDEVTALKSAPGKDIVCTGSISLVHALTAARLVDEYRLFVYPVVVGRGRRLFAEGQDAGPLQLVQAHAFRSGIVLMRYRTGTGS